MRVNGGCRESERENRGNKKKIKNWESKKKKMKKEQNNNNNN